MENEVKEPALKYPLISQEDYLAMERSATEKHEYFKGEVFAMSGASMDHNLIVNNINTLVLPFLKGKGCKMFGSDLRIHIPENTLFTYPDLSIICGTPVTTSDEKDNFISPSVLIEVLSKSTRDYDRGSKFTLYRSIRSLKEYITIDSLSVNVEVWKRNPDDSWVLHDFRIITDSFTISTIGFTLQLSDIYEDVTFAE